MQETQNSILNHKMVEANEKYLHNSRTAKAADKKHNHTYIHVVKHLARSTTV